MSGYTESQVARIATAAAREALAGAKGVDQTQLSNIALAAAKEAVRETHAELFALLGINIADFDKLNRFRDNLTFLNSLNSDKTRENLTFLNSLHSSAASAGRRATLTVISTVVAILMLALGIGVAHLVQSSPPIPTRIK